MISNYLLLINCNHLNTYCGVQTYYITSVVTLHWNEKYLTLDINNQKVDFIAGKEAAMF